MAAVIRGRLAGHRQIVPLCVHCRLRVVPTSIEPLNVRVRAVWISDNEVKLIQQAVGKVVIDLHASGLHEDALEFASMLDRMMEQLEIQGYQRG